MIFDNKQIVQWHRDKMFQALSLRLIGRDTVNACPSYVNNHVNLSLSGSIHDLSYVLPKHVIVYASVQNPGVHTLVEELQIFLSQKSSRSSVDEWNKDNVISRFSNDARLIKIHDRRTSRVRRFSFSSLEDHQGSASARTRPTHMLLLLNVHTFLGRAGAVLAGEVRNAQKLGVRLVSVHELDPSKLTQFVA